MADVVYSTDPLMGLYQDHSDIRREAVEHTTEIVKEGLKGDFGTLSAIKDSRHDISDTVGSVADRLQNDVNMGVNNILQRNTDYFIASQNRQFDQAQAVAALKATTDMGFMKIASDIVAGIDRSAAASALESAKVAAAVQLGQAQLERTIYQDGNETRRLINELKVSDLERQLIERNADLVEHRGEARHWRGHYENTQFNALVSQLNAFQSQLQETRQGMVNFGTMAGVGQSSTSNNVR